ncbi:MAG: hypothetical protein ABFD94_17205, partial [Armatimonadia bacterium]
AKKSGTAQDGTIGLASLQDPQDLHEMQGFSDSSYRSEVMFMVHASCDRYLPHHPARAPERRQ